MVIKSKEQKLLELNNYILENERIYSSVPEYLKLSGINSGHLVEHIKNLKIDSKHKIFSMIITNYSKVISNFVYAYFGLNLWSFSFSRLTASSLYCIYLLYISIFHFNLEGLCFGRM